MYALQDLGWTDSHTTDFEPHAAEGRIPARVAAQHRGAYVVFSELGELRADTAGRLSHEAAGAGELPAVGDWVAIAPRPEEEAATIHAVVSRRTKFSRKVALNATEEQVLAANIDAVFLVMSLNEDFNLRRLERYVTMAWESGAQPVIVLTKTDLCPDFELRVLEVEAIAFGIPVHAISSLTGDGLDLIRAHLAPGRTIALLGSSGVGKSTLVNTLAGEELLATQTIREDDGEGRHTTTAPSARPAPRRRPRRGHARLARAAALGIVGRALARPSRTSRSSRRGAASRIALTAPSPGAPSRRRSRTGRCRSPAGRATRSCSASWPTSSGGSTSDSRPRSASAGPRPARRAARTCGRRGVADALTRGQFGVRSRRDVVVNAQSVAASFVSLPFGSRESEPVTVFESATFAGSGVPSTKSYVPEPMIAAWIEPS